ncbi:TPA: hypothetical protein ACX3DO_004507 [Vibrio parahaemolyticus]|uniref:hypothetical protein n=1 Tax=Vibrio parahaemolyticus TaxID=670 RepID=UPI00186AAA50|nr:hypothetical protein [Vibrio parahaemolyticus]MBE4323171.1 hypothetical protein [Vibrio parahaemolyticus]MBE4341310.1 hypothetical protein [Vibrio parahaemolyticus]
MIDSVDFQSFIATESVYFSKYGKGGVLICADGDKAYSLANDYNSRNDFNSFVGDNFKKVRGIQINDESVAVIIELSGVNVVKRIMPKTEVTVEIYGVQSQA